jgi:fatty acid desaturase
MYCLSQRDYVIKTETMEDNAKLIESLLERATEYGKTSFELVKLRTIDKISDIFSTVIAHILVFVLIALFMLFFNFGIAFWLGEMLGKIYCGFLIVAAFYAIIGIICHFFMHKCLKKKIYNYVINQILK